MINSILEKLEVFNDIDFKFDPHQHKYTYHNKEYTSVTRFISRFHVEFDSDYWSKEKASQEGISQEEILLRWKLTNDRSNQIGTSVHFWIENYYNKVYQELPTDIDIIDRINKFNISYAKYLYKLTPIKFEQRIFSKKWNIAGTIDSIFLYHGKLFIVDYKTNKDFTTDENLKFRDFLLPPFNNLYKTHLNEYSIQVSLYILILREYGFDIGGGYLLHIGPSEDAKIHRCLDLTNQLESYLNDCLKES